MIRLMNYGIKFIEDIEEFNGVMQAFFYDDDRNMIEINNTTIAGLNEDNNNR